MAVFVSVFENILLTFHRKSDDIALISVKAKKVNKFYSR